MSALVLDRSSARTLIAFGDETLELPGRDPTWCDRLRALLAGYRPDLLAVGLGPGSFAGVRSSIACLQGMGLALGLRPKGFPSAALCALASGLPEVTVVGDARRNTLWAARFSVGPDAIAPARGAPPSDRRALRGSRALLSPPRRWGRPRRVI